jgi:hypothetical protein
VFFSFERWGDWVHLIRRQLLLSLLYQHRIMTIDERGKDRSPLSFCSPQIPHDLTGDLTRATAVESRRLTAWAMAQPQWVLTLCNKTACFIGVRKAWAQMHSLIGRSESVNWITTKFHIAYLVSTIHWALPPHGKPHRFREFAMFLFYIIIVIQSNDLNGSSSYQATMSCSVSKSSELVSHLRSSQEEITGTRVLMVSSS